MEYTYTLGETLQLLQDYLVKYPEQAGAPLYMYDSYNATVYPVMKIAMKKEIFCMNGDETVSKPEECGEKSYVCRHCSADLDRGDVYEVLKKQNDEITPAHHRKSDAEIRKAAASYGWSEKNRLHFTAEVIVQPDRGKQYMECPKCKGLDPLAKNWAGLNPQRWIISKQAT